MKGHGVPAVDLLPVLQERLVHEGKKTEAYFLDEVHLSREGHRVVAESLAPILRYMSDGLLTLEGRVR